MVGHCLVETRFQNILPVEMGACPDGFGRAVLSAHGVMFGAGVVIPIVGPTFRGFTQQGSPAPLVLPGPVGGQLSVGTSWRF